MNTIAGAASFACANRSRTREAPTPTIASTNSDADIEKNGTSASPATARASSVLPVPGGPHSSTPCGMRPPSRSYLSGLAQEVDDLRQLGLRLVDPGDVRERDAVARRLVAARLRAAERAEHVLHAPSRAASARRAGRRRGASARSRRSRLSHHGAPVSSGSALTTTPFCSSSCESAIVSANAGISVWKRVVGFEPW